MAIRDKVGRYAGTPSRQVGVTRPAKGPARGLGGDYPGGDACFGPRRATNTPHKLPTENSAQIPRVWLISHRICLICEVSINLGQFFNIFCFLINKVALREIRDYLAFLGIYPLFWQRLLEC
jgi:hypothetical protein